MNKNLPTNQSGVMLIEALVGILIFSIGILALMGMQAVSMRATLDSKYRSEASFLANEIVGVMWSDPANLANYDTTACTSTTACAAWMTKVQAQLPQATGSNAPTISVASRQVTVTVKWMRPGETTASQHNIVAQIYRASD